MPLRYVCLSCILVLCRFFESGAGPSGPPIYKRFRFGVVRYNMRPSVILTQSHCSRLVDVYHRSFYSSIERACCAQLSKIYLKRCELQIRTFLFSFHLKFPRQK